MDTTFSPGSAAAVLAIDTAFAACQVALVDGSGKLRAGHSLAMARGQAEVLPGLVAQTLAEAGLGFAALDLVAVTVGPGSFTGVRVALAAARGFALVADCPVAGVSTLEVLAHAVPDEARARGDEVLSVISARRGQVYFQRFRAGTRPDALGPARVCSLGEVAESGQGSIWAVGDAAAEAVAAGCAGRAVAEALLPRPADLAALALLDLCEGRVRPALPLYVRGPGAEPARPQDAR